MSPSKKPSKKSHKKNSKSAQKIKKTSVRSSRATIKHVSSKQKSNHSQPEAQARQPAAMTMNPSMQVVESKTFDTPKTSSWRTNLLRVLALLAVIAITIYIISIRDRVEEFRQYGYWGVFFVALLANATVFVPAPGVAIIYAMGAVFNPLYVGLAAGTGGALGELSGYLAGFSGQAIVERTEVYSGIKPWVEKYGGWAILVLSAIPNPLFDVAGFAAGIAKMKMRTFLVSVWIGQLIKMTLFAYAGNYSVEWISNLIK